MTKYWCWDVDNGDREDERPVSMTGFLDGPLYAAEEFAKMKFDSSDAVDSFTIAVREDGSEVVRIFDVTVEYNPTFSASERSDR